MRDEMYDREFQQGRAALNDGIDRLIARVASFWLATGRAQVRAEWDAPWHRSSQRHRRDGLA